MTRDEIVEEEWKTDLRKEYRKKTLSMAKEVSATGTYEKVEGMICDWWFDKLTTTAQRLKADWLRSEIEKLESSEKMKSKIGFEKDGTKMQQIKQRVYAQGHNQALTSIITRYKEELKVLESK